MVSSYGTCANIEGGYTNINIYYALSLHSGLFTYTSCDIFFITLINGTGKKANICYSEGVAKNTTYIQGYMLFPGKAK